MPFYGFVACWLVVVVFLADLTRAYYADFDVKLMTLPPTALGGLLDAVKLKAATGNYWTRLDGVGNPVLKKAIRRLVALVTGDRTVHRDEQLLPDENLDLTFAELDRDGIIQLDMEV